MENEILKEIQFLREGLSAFSKRLDQLESQLRTSIAPAVAPSPLPVPLSPSQPATAPNPPAPPKAAPLQPTAPAPTPVHPAAAMKEIGKTPPSSSHIETPATISTQQSPCSQHPDKTIRWHCITCQTSLCSDCGGVAWHGHVYCRKCVNQVSPASEKSAEEKRRKTWETFETKVGRYWLNRIGIASLVLGVVFFILYTFQYFGPAVKIAIGMMVAGGLLRSEKHK